MVRFYGIYTSAQDVAIAYHVPMNIRGLYTCYTRAPEIEGGAAAPVEPATADAGAQAAEAAAAAPEASADAGKPDLAAMAAANGGSLLEEGAAKLAEGGKPGEEAAAADGEKKPEAEAAKPDGEAAAGEGEKKAEGEAEPKPEAEPHKPFEFQDFTIPEGVTVDAAKVKEFTGILDNPELNPQERGQKLMDMFTGEMNRFSEAMVQHQRDVWTAITDGWKEDFRKDPEIGGARQDTTLLTAAALVDQVLTPEEKKEYFDVLNVSGVGNHRLHLKLLAHAGKALNVFEDGITVPQSQKPVTKREFGTGWYGGGAT